MSQNSEILQHLESGKTLTSLEALKMFGTMRLAARIRDLRKAGIEIECSAHSVRTSRGTVSRVAKYQIRWV